MHQGTIVTAGITGGWGAGAVLVATVVCAATAPVCIGIAAFVGGIVASNYRTHHSCPATVKTTA